MLAPGPGAVAGEAGAAAQPADPPLRWSAAALFAGGAATAFLAHEGGHLAANLLVGNQPRVEPTRGTIPFLALDPGIECDPHGGCRKRDGARFGAGRRGLFLIESAGLQVQQYSDEVILTLSPRLREEEAPFRKGMLALNTLTSIGYVLADRMGWEPPTGDVRGLTRDTGVSRDAVAALVLGVAVIDLVRYFQPEARWLAWLSRAAKVATTGLVLTL